MALTVACSTAGNIYKHKHFIQQTSSGINCGTQYSQEYLQHTNTLYSKPVVALTVARSTARNIYKHKHFIQQTSSGINCGTQYSWEYLQTHKHFIQQTSSGINCGMQYSREYLQHTNTLYSKPVVSLTVARSTARNIYNTQTLYTANQ